MSTSYAKHFSTLRTPQSEPIPGSTQVANSAGGFAWAVDDWTRLNRFLILGNEGGSYYASEKALTVENATAVLACIKADGVRTVNRIVEVSDGGKAPKNDAAIFALALACSHGNEETKREAFSALPRVARIGTHLFQFAESVQAFRGWGRGLRRAVAEWYTEKSTDDLSFQLAKYQQRNGWSHRDLLRLSHPKADGLRSAILRWAVKGAWSPEYSCRTIDAMRAAHAATDKRHVAALIRECGLPRECIPTQWLNEPEVWDALLDKMPLTALVRNLATMTRIGLLAPMSNAVGKVLADLSNTEWLRKSRLHPVSILAALMTYRAGRGVRGQHTWSPVAQVCDALDSAFYKSFGNIEPTNKRWMLALDISGSMGSGEIAGVPGLSPRIGSAAMALVTANVERQHCFTAFTSSGYSIGRGQYSHLGFGTGISDLSISPRQRLDDVVRQVSNLPMGGTDCALPMLYAMEKKIPVDVFCIFTDSETWHGAIHPSQALQQYRQKMGIGAKLIVVGMVSNEFTIASPNDSGMLDIVGFDLDAPSVMSEFAGHA